MKVRLQHEDTGQIKDKAVSGFSWTLFLFGIFAPLFRGEFLNALLLWLVNILCYVIGGYMYGGIIVFVVDAIIASFYNKLVIENLGRKGYKPATQQDASLLKQQGIQIL